MKVTKMVGFMKPRVSLIIFVMDNRYEYILEILLSKIHYQSYWKMG